MTRCRKAGLSLTGLCRLACPKEGSCRGGGERGGGTEGPLAGRESSRAPPGRVGSGSCPGGASAAAQADAWRSLSRGPWEVAPGPGSQKRRDRKCCCFETLNVRAPFYRNRGLRWAASDETESNVAWPPVCHFVTLEPLSRVLLCELEVPTLPHHRHHGG